MLMETLRNDPYVAEPKSGVDRLCLWGIAEYIFGPIRCTVSLKPRMCLIHFNYEPTNMYLKLSARALHDFKFVSARLLCKSLLIRVVAPYLAP